MNNSIVTIQYNDFPVVFQSDAFLNATAIAKQFGKKTEGYLRTNETKEYIAALEKWLFPAENSNALKSAIQQNQILSVTPKSATEKNQLVIVKGGSSENGGGTWLHPKLAVHFARWLDVRFAVWCDMQIDKLLKPVPNALRELPRPNITGMEAAQFKRAVEAACKTNKRLYSELYRKLYAAYGIDSYLNLPAGKLNEALVFLGLKPVEMPKTVMIPVEEYEALKNAHAKKQPDGDFPTITLSVPDDSYKRILVTKHKGMTMIYELAHDILVVTIDEISRDISTDYVVMKKEELIKKIEQFKA